MSHVMNTYARLPISLVKGEGVWVWDDADNKYLDALAGIAVNGLGHCHPQLVKAITEQVKTLIHVSNIYHIPQQEKLADLICEISGMDQVFFANSGAEANEAAIKLARLYGHKKGLHDSKIIVMEKSFHGRTLATLSATGNAKVQRGFEPVVSGFLRAEYGNLEAIKTLARQYNNISAILVEPVQGEGGIHLMPASYLQGLRQICDENDWLLMLDEVQCGIGRTGTWFAFQHAGILPDVMSLAKGLGSGVPIGASVVAGKATNLFQPGNHGSTFGGNPLVCAAGLATIQTMQEEKLLENAVKMGSLIQAQLSAALKGVEGVMDIRGQGLMIGVELVKPCGELVKLALAKGLLINVTADKVIRLVPPLIIQAHEVTMLVEKLSELICQFLKN